MEFIINNRKIGIGETPFIIAEACINHQGDFEIAKQMVKKAHSIGIDCIKFQIHFLENEMLKDTPISDNFDDSLWDTLEKTNLTISEHIQLKELCEKLGIIYLCTPFSRDGADALEEIGVDFYKVGSGELTNLPLIEHIAKKGKPMIVSTGMSEVSEIKETVDLIKDFKIPLILTHCTSAYPCPYEIVNLGFIEKLQNLFQIPVGLSDHTKGIYTSLGAVAKGACVIEKHFTLDKNQEGPDHQSSLEPEELSELHKGVKAVYLSLGNQKKIHEQEKQILAWAREAVVSEVDIKKGDRLTYKNIWVKRPSPIKGAIPAKEYKNVIGKKALIDIKKNSQILWSQIE